MDSWIVPTWSLKNKEVFRIGLVDRPCLLLRIAPHRAKKRGGVQNWTHKFLFWVFDTVLLSAHVERVSVYRTRDFSFTGCIILKPQQSFKKSKARIIESK